MQVPESFFYKSTASSERTERKERKALESSEEDGFNKVMERQEQPKSKDDALKRFGSWASAKQDTEQMASQVPVAKTPEPAREEPVEREEEGSFSLFEQPPKRVKGSPQNARPSGGGSHVAATRQQPEASPTTGNGVGRAMPQDDELWAMEEELPPPTDEDFPLPPALAAAPSQPVNKPVPAPTLTYSQTEAPAEPESPVPAETQTATTLPPAAQPLPEAPKPLLAAAMVAEQHPMPAGVMKKEDNPPPSTPTAKKNTSTATTTPSSNAETGEQVRQAGSTTRPPPSLASHDEDTASFTAAGAPPAFEGEEMPPEALATANKNVATPQPLTKEELAFMATAQTATPREVRPLSTPEEAPAPPKKTSAGSSSTKAPAQGGAMATAAAAAGSSQTMAPLSDEGEGSANAGMSGDSDQTFEVPPAPVRNDIPPSTEQVVQRQYQAPQKVQAEQQASQAGAAVGFIYVPKKKEDEEKIALFEYVAPSQEERALRSQGAAGSAAHTTFVAEENKESFLDTVDERNAKPSAPDMTAQPMRQKLQAGSSQHAAAWQQTVEQQQPDVRVALQAEMPPTAPAAAKTKAPPPKGFPAGPNAPTTAEETSPTTAAPQGPEAPLPAKKTATPFEEEVIIDPTAIASLLPNPAVSMSTDTPAINTVAAPPPPLAPRLQEIVDQIVKNMYTVSKDGVTDTTFELGRPPLLRGVKVTITTFEHARKEMNITFSNVVTNSGQRLLEENLGSLKADLEYNHGFIVHQLHTTQADTLPSYALDASEQERPRDEQPDQQQERRRRPEDIAAEQEPDSTL